MPNGLSCAYFAIRNHMSGQKEHNVFKEGIAYAQAARTLDSIAKTSEGAEKIAAPVSNFLNGIAKIARKIVYPFIILSGIYNTAKSEDKVKTGVSQGLGISTMATFEAIAEKYLMKGAKYMLDKPFMKQNRIARIGLYAVKGLAFVTASLTGYNIGTKLGDKIVDKLRGENYKKEESVFAEIEDKFMPNEDNFGDISLEQNSQNHK